MSIFPFQSPIVFIPIPNIGQDKKRVSRKRCKTPILISSLHKNELVAAKELEKEKNSSKFLSVLKKGTNKCGKGGKKSERKRERERDNFQILKG
jgi:hypothetical protein